MKKTTIFILSKGHMASSKMYGVRAAATLAGIWEGWRPEPIIREDGSSQQIIIDYKIAQKYGITRFPAETVFVNKPVSFFEKNRRLIVFFTSIIAVLIVIIILLLFVIRGRIQLQKKNDQIGKLNLEIIDTQKEIISRLGDIIETRSHETANHVHRVARISEAVARLYGLGDDEIRILGIISPMHDIGKIGIADKILNKPGRLSEEEYEIMKFHTKIGYEILRKTDKEILRYASIIALEHHEKWNGSGYPNGTAGEEIHIFARITAIADIYDALRSKRSYKKEWSVEDAAEYIKKESGITFDPALAEILIENLDDFEAIRSQNPENELNELSDIYNLLKKNYESFSEGRE